MDCYKFGFKKIRNSEEGIKQTMHSLTQIHVKKIKNHEWLLKHAVGILSKNNLSEKKYEELRGIFNNISDPKNVRISNA